MGEMIRDGQASDVKQKTSVVHSAENKFIHKRKPA